MKSTCWGIMVNYRTSGLAIDSLRSLSGQVLALGDGSVLVVDNFSGDSSTERIAAVIRHSGWSSWARVVPAERNGGFAFGNNVGIRMAMSDPTPPDYVMLLNPDTVVRPGAIKALVEFMDAHPQVGIAGSLLGNSEGGVDCSAHRMHSPLSELDGGARLGVLSRLLRWYVVSEVPRSEAHACDWVSGASMIIRRRVIEDIGLMDERFFLYFEEVDYCWRAKKAGWEIWYVPQARVLHLEGASTGISTGSRRRATYWYDSRRRFFIKHYGISGLLLADVLWTVGRLSFLLRRQLKMGAQGENRDPTRFMADLLGGDLRAVIMGDAWRIGREMPRS